jgi:hypothetical protein
MFKENAAYWFEHYAAGKPVTAGFTVLQSVTPHTVLYQKCTSISQDLHPSSHFFGGYINSFAVFVFRGNLLVNLYRNKRRQAVMLLVRHICNSPLRTQDRVNLLFLLNGNTYFVFGGVCERGVKLFCCMTSDFGRGINEISALLTCYAEDIGSYIHTYLLHGAESFLKS